ncbi:facilitated trehalose transporter Tret1-like [Nasonia vitripennis]|uniref:Major facilitator superfamily (MFS) profile domain-containing protein n=1 Tax=Nasonia vitripennis TaxID=7425 RepID=A0A7M7G3M7_NASVI|nr:facilitated trehalose transporter Tret1-like [Nasonia vitripennis]
MNNNITVNGEHKSNEIDREIKQNLSDIDYDKENKASAFRILASQSYATLATNMLKFSYGACMGFTTIFLIELAKKDAEIKVTFAELTWYSTYFFMIPVGSIVGGVVAQWMGSRLLMMLAAAMVVFSWLLYHFATNSSMVLFAQAINGAAGGMTKGPGLTYIAEISQPRLRGTLMSTATLFYLAGQFFAVLLGGYLYWRTVALVNLVVPVIGLIMCCFIPHSPHWLASKNRIEDAQRSLAWLRGWTTKECIKSEFDTFMNTLEMSRKKTMTDESIGSSSFGHRLKRTVLPYLHRSFYIPLAVSCYIYFINTFGGSHSTQSYAGLIFQQIKSPLEAHTGTIILNAGRTLGAVSCLFTIRLVGKRKLIFFSLFGGGVSYAVAAIFNVLMENNQIDSKKYAWVPTISIIMAIFMIAAGIDKIMHLINSEIIPLQYRLVGSGIGQTFYNLNLATLNKVFLYVAGYVTLSGMFAGFATINLIGFLTIYFILPETEGRSLAEIEEHYSGVRKLTDKKKGDKDNDVPA